MKAAVYETYGPSDVVQIADVAKPIPRGNEVLVQVEATTVTTADWRLRASAFPGGLWLPGRLMTGLFRPRNKVLGGEFAGKIAQVGLAVTGFKVGDPVFGFAEHGAHAEYLTIKETGAITHRPENLTASQAAALPFGGLAALVFLRDIAKLKEGQSILILGASGNVGVYAVQIAKAMGATVTAVASAKKRELLTDLGASAVIDYRSEDALDGRQTYDIVLDPAGFSTFKTARNALTSKGVYVALNFGLQDVPRVLLGKITGGKKMRIGVNSDTRADLDTLCAMIAKGQLRPVIDRVLPLGSIRDAYAHVEGRHRRGSVVLTVGGYARAAESAA